MDTWHETRGVDALWDVVADLHRTFPDLTLEVTDRASDGDRVTTAWTKGTDKGGLFAMSPTGNRIELRAICLDDVVDGRVTRHQQVSDMWRLARHSASSQRTGKQTAHLSYPIDPACTPR